MTLTEELATMAPTRAEAASHLQADWAGIRLSFGRMGVRKTLDRGQKQTAADPFDADADYLSAGKKLIDTKDPAFKAVTAVIGKARAAWLDATLPYVDPGVRLIRQDLVQSLTGKLGGYRDELNEAVANLATVYDDLKERAKSALGDLYNAADYPDSLDGLFRIDWDLPSLAPPEYLKSMNPTLYAEQSARIAARFDAAVGMAEEMFIGELFKAVDCLQTKLQGLDDGTEKRLHETAIGNLREFFERFRSLNVHSSAELDRVVAQAEEVISGRNLLGGRDITREELRDSASLRADIRTRLSAVSSVIEGMMVSAPRRALNRRKKAETTTDAPAE